MTPWKYSERLMAMDKKTWKRHANPLSGWSRITKLPLLCVAIWSRVWLGLWSMVPVTVVLIWTWANPRLFSPPKDNAAWMTRAVLGERLSLANLERQVANHHKKVARLLAIASGLGCVLIAVALWMLCLEALISGLILAMGAKLWFLDRMVWLFEDHEISTRSRSKEILT